MLKSNCPAVTFRLITVRHGETDANKVMRVQGHIDTPLNALGKEQAKRAGIALSSYRWTRAYCSDLQRTRQTALRILAGSKQQPTPPLVQDERVKERNYGEWENCYYNDIRAEMAAKNISIEGYNPEGSETIGEVNQRFINFFKTLCQSVYDKNKATVLADPSRAQGGNVSRTADSTKECKTADSEKDSKTADNAKSISVDSAKYCNSVDTAKVCNSVDGYPLDSSSLATEDSITIPQSEEILCSDVKESEICETILLVSHGYALRIFFNHLATNLHCKLPIPSDTMSPNTSFSVFTIRYSPCTYGVVCHVFKMADHINNIKAEDCDNAGHVEENGSQDNTQDKDGGAEDNKDDADKKEI